MLGSSVGIAGVRPKQYENFTNLTLRRSEFELTGLTNHPNAVVRCYSFWALARKSRRPLLPIILAHLNDTIEVETLSGCMGDRIMVGDFFIGVVSGNFEGRNHRLTKNQSAILDKSLLASDNPLRARAALIEQYKKQFIQ